MGAINATAIGCGLNLEEIIQIWKTIERGRVYRLSIWQQILHLLFRRGFTPFMDTEPLKRLLHGSMNIPHLRTSDIEIIITAVNILTSEIKFFNNRVIDIEHVMASSAIPILFPWQYIDGVPHWDGGVMMNNPILPALERGVKEIIVVLLSPVGGERLSVPRTRREAIERVFEQQLIGSYEAFMAHLAYDQKIRGQTNIIQKMVRRSWSSGDLRIVTVAPERMLGFHSILNFTTRQADYLIREGFIDAKNQLADFFNLSDDPY